MELFEQAEKLITDVAIDYPVTAARMTEALDCLKGVSCTADADGKGDAFADARAVLNMAAKKCVKRQEEIKALYGLLDEGVTVKCSGGG